MTVSDTDLAILAQEVEETFRRRPPRTTTETAAAAEKRTASAAAVPVVRRDLPLAERSNLDLLLDTEGVSFDMAMSIIADRQARGYKGMPAPKPKPPKLPDGLTLDELVAIATPVIADATKTSKERVRLLWFSAKSARELATAKEVHAAFTQMATETGLINKNGYWGADINESRCRYGAQDVDRVIRCALRGMNPFEQ